MTVEEMKSILEKARQHGRENNGKVLMCSERGPAGFDMIQALLSLVEQQQKEIEALKAKFIS